MIKSRHPPFNRKISKQLNNNAHTEEIGSLNKQRKSNAHTEEVDPITTRRSYFKFTRNPNNLTTIIRDLQRNVKQLKNFHQSQQKIKYAKLQKSSSLNQVNRIRCNSKTKIKSQCIKSLRAVLKGNQNNLENRKNQQNQKNVAVQSIISKNQFQNGSTMLSINNGDVEEVKKAYQNIYGKQNPNIVDLYNFFRKNTQKSTRIHGSMQMSSCPYNQHSEDLYKSRELNYHRKSNEYLNVIIQDKQQKQHQCDASKDLQNQCSSIYRRTAQKNPTMQQIFKNGCPDLANVYDFVKKRRVSLKNYIYSNKNKQNRVFIKRTDLQTNQQWCKAKKQKRDLFKNQYTVEAENPVKLKQQYQLMKALLASPSLKSKPSDLNNMTAQEPQLSYKKYLLSKNSKLSQKSSAKNSKKKQAVDLDQNICGQQIDQFKLNRQNKQNQDRENVIQNLEFDDNYGNSQCKKIQKFKKSKYYVQPLPFKKENSLDGCSISVKSSSRIIQLDFIPLDL